MASSPIVFYDSSTKSLKFAVVSDSEVQYYQSQYPGAVWVGEEQLQTSQLKQAPWKEFKTQIEEVVFASSFSSVRPRTVYSWFSGLTNLTAVKGLENLNLSETTEMRSMFSGCVSLKEIDLSMLNTRNVQYMGNMFYGCTSLTSVKFGSINTSNVLSMASMFQGASKLESVDISKLDLSNVNSLSKMFQECTALKTVKFPKFYTSNLTDMSYLFYKCNLLQFVDLSGFNTRNVTTMSCMFEFCSSLLEVDLNNFDTTSLSVADEMFSHCIRLKKIYSDKDWQVPSIMFFNCPNLSGSIVFNSQKYSGFLFANTTNGYFTPSNFGERRACVIFCEGDGTLYFTSSQTPFHIGNSFNGSTITDYWWCDDVTDCTALGKSVWLNAYNSASIKSVVFTKEFMNAAKKVKTAKGWFEKCSALRSVEGWEYFDTSQLTNMGRMFSQCASIKSLPGISAINTSNVTDMDSLFYECRLLEDIDVSGFKTANVKNFSDMFGRCYALTSIDVTNFNTDKAESFKEMFYYCTGIKTIFCDKTWNKDVPSKNMFYRCEKLKGSISYDSFKTDAAYANPENGYFTKMQSYNLWICGTQVSSMNCADLTVIDGVEVSSNDGYFYYDPESNTLKIKNGVAASENGYALRNNIKDLTIETDRDGEASLSTVNGNAAMLVEKRTYITGGPLKLRGGSFSKPSAPGLIAMHMVRVEDGILQTEGTYGISGYYISDVGSITYYGGLTVNGHSMVSVYGSEACIATLGIFSLGENVKIVTPVGAEFNNKYLRLDGEILQGTFAVIAYEEPGVVGDVNKDGNVDISDIVAVINTIAGDTTYENTADVNGDTAVDISDIVAIINIIASN